MLKNHFIIAFRNLKKYRIFSIINFFGLAIGISCTLAIWMYVQNEQSYDKHYSQKDRIYRVNKRAKGPTGEWELHAINAGLAGPSLETDFPEIEMATRVLPWFDDMPLKYESKRITTPLAVFTDSSFCDLFDVKFIQRGAGEILAGPGKIVLTDKLAERLFGEEDPIGKSVEGLNGMTFSITGVIESPSSYTHLQYEALVSWESTGEGGLNFSWMNNWRAQVAYTYVLLNNQMNPKGVEAKFPAFVEKYMPDRVDVYELYLQPLEDIYLYSSDVLFSRKIRQGNSDNIRVFTFIAIFILLIACINYINISTSYATKRAREVGIRKVLGAHRKHLIFQFMGESFLLTLGASLLGIILLDLMLPFFNQITGSELVFRLADVTQWGIYLVVIIFSVSLLAGTYPALFLSHFEAIKVLKSLHLKLGGNLSRQLLIGFQFTVSICLIAVAIFVYQQTSYLKTKNLGFDRSQLVKLEIGDNIGEKYDAFKQELLQHPNIQSIARGRSMPGGGKISTVIIPEGLSDTKVETNFARLDESFQETFQVEMLEGRFLSDDFGQDSIQNLVVNESFIKQIGWESAIGKQVFYEDGQLAGRIIGVMKDFHFESLYQPIEPLISFYSSRNAVEVAIKILPSDIPETLAHIGETWQNFEQEEPFSYQFLDEQFATYYEKEEKLLKGITAFSLIAILIACMGLYGLAAFTIEQKTKEIGIRKVLGANAQHILWLLNSKFVVILFISLFVAIPLAYFGIYTWLMDFPYRIHIELWVFILAGGLTFFVAIFAVSYQGLRVAITNPADSLRYE